MLQGRCRQCGQLVEARATSEHHPPLIVEHERSVWPVLIQMVGCEGAGHPPVDNVVTESSDSPTA